MSTRREFIIRCSTLTAGMLVPMGALAETAFRPRRQRGVEELSCSAFAGQLNTPFRIRAGCTRHVTVKLVEVRVTPEPLLSPGRRPPSDAANEKFSLIFSGSRRDLLEQEIYLFEHETLGRFSFFIVPIFTRNLDKINYEAVINRPRANAIAAAAGGPGSHVPSADCSTLAEII
jgi:hypothetical protein